MGLCERCRKAQATFHMTNIEASGTKKERHLCERCEGRGWVYLECECGELATCSWVATQAPACEDCRRLHECAYLYRDYTGTGSPATINESPSYRAALIDAGRGRLLR